MNSVNKMKSLLVSVVIAVTGVTGSAQAEVFLRYTADQLNSSELSQIIGRLRADSSLDLSEADFVLSEDRDLAYEHYQRWDQIKQGLMVKGRSIRVWKAFKTNELILAEASLDDTPEQVTESAFTTVSVVQEAFFNKSARLLVVQSDDARLRSFSHAVVWHDAETVYEITAKAARGSHYFTFSLATNALLENTYLPYPNSDLAAFERRDEFSLPALVFPLYEEYKGQRLPRKAVRLKYLSKTVQVPNGDPFAPLQNRSYPWSKHDSVLGNTSDGQAAGYWSMDWLKGQIAALQQATPWKPNRFGQGAVYLHGRYATINIHPQAFAAFPQANIPQQYSNNAAFIWQEDAANNDYLIKPTGTFLGKPLARRYDAWKRDAARHPSHDPATYINNGFDEVQVYYAINELFDSLRPRGFVDPDLAERPFHAILFDPDIESQDNAYYDEDTINFSTYSPEALNYARDNTTIWHELGHGVMDRLMGTKLRLADTGGLSEGMADFVAELVVKASYGSQTFPGEEDQRILNNIGFFLTNEVHDDGEAYGGTMKGILDLAIASYGPERGLKMVTDLVLEAMRLSRDHPHLTAEDWFQSVEFADHLGRPGVRAPDQLSTLIHEALDARNFAAEGARASFFLSYHGVAVDSGTAGSRGREVRLDLAPDAVSTHEIQVSLQEPGVYKFKYPVTVKVFYNSGPLQGAIDWVGEDQEPSLFTVNQPGEVLTIPLQVNGTCDSINRTDGSCSDFAYIQIWNNGETQPVAKKRFYLRIYNL